MINNSSLEKLEYTKIINTIKNYCVTETGKNIAADTKPLYDLNQINLTGILVTEAKTLLTDFEYPPLVSLPDISAALLRSKVEGGSLSSKEILSVLELAVTSRNLFAYLNKYKTETPALSNNKNNLFVDKVFELHINKVFSSSGEILDSASSKLSVIRKEISEKKDELIRLINKLCKKLSDKEILQEEYLTLRDGRIVVPVKVEHKRHLKGFIHSESATGQTVYIEPEESLDLNNEILSLSFEEKREIDRILKQLTVVISQRSSELKKSLETVGLIDSFFAKAKYSLEIRGNFPSFDLNAPISLLNARHPLLIKKLGYQNTVPLNVFINNQRIILITGPNAGGKTVVLKTFGLLQLMVQSGLHIPADSDSNFHLFKNIWVDIGDNQSLENDLSTFSSHLQNIKQIISEADSNSLVLLDEIGTGTDPQEGSAIAAAVLKKLLDLNSLTLATTHHGLLKIIAAETEGFQNAAMEFDTGKLTPTYKFKQNQAGSSYAFEIAENLGFTRGFISEAKKFMNTENYKIDDFLIEIEKKSQLLDAKLKNSEIENSRLKGLVNLYQNKIDKLKHERKEILKKTKSEADEYLSKIKISFEKIVKQIKESNAEKSVIKESKQKLKKLEEFVNDIIKEDEESETNSSFNEGDYVRIKNTQTVGQILELNDNKATVVSGGIKFQAELKSLIKAEKKELPKNSYSFNSNYFKSYTQIRLDIRGLRVDEAEFKIIKFLDDAYSKGLDRVEILHGKGSGALKNLVNEILKFHEKVKNFYFAPLEMGGDGITIVEYYKD